ncbi:DUF4847 family protein [Bacteroides faecium]|uniref:DUF4847 domain-containing protein n=1 Tax=Bacteroides faecium TaxID=2715212 RepID=A0A6H0KN00_9BACE|nr:DUF4847 family protein [Bacteroides faecium]QIU94655.1 DUF4847 domain-containing protein [Bacteroides faecium]
MKKNIFQIVGLFLLLPLLAGCNDTDDVAAIFTGKTWKLNYITVDGGHEMFNFWGTDNTARTKSYEELEKSGSYNIVFDGIADGDIINGKIRGTIVKSFALEGSWSANGKDNSFSASVSGNDGGDVLAKNFMEGLKTATSYEGDTNGNLYLIYKGGQQTFRMVFRVVNN